MHRRIPAYKIVFEDEDLLLTVKEAGIPVIRERAKQPVPALYDRLKERHYPNLKVVHRIDKNTSGLVLFAKGYKAQRALSEQFSDRKIKKHYLAIIEGRYIEKEWKEIDAPVLSLENTTKVLIHKKGKTAKTLYRSIEVFDRASLLELQLITGRTHQIRAHLAHIGYPLLVDDLYGVRKSILLSELLTRKYHLKAGTAERPLMDRHTLHAYRLQFTHPAKKTEMKFEAESPKDWKALLNQLRKNSKFHESF